MPKEQETSALWWVAGPKGVKDMSKRIPVVDDGALTSSATAN
jgi:hypothetical protein